jgi:hypothetical protein
VVTTIAAEAGEAGSMLFSLKGIAMTEIKLEKTHMSRRTLLRNAACLAGAAPLLVITANSAQAAKLSKKAVGYQDSPQGDRDCSNCKLFEPPSGCRSVEGPVSAKGWCKIWVKK